MKTPGELAALNALDALNIPYTYIEHPAANTMEDCYVIDESLGAVHFKNLFLCNRQGTEFYLLLLEGSKPFKTAQVSKQLGVSRLSFGNADQLGQILGLLPGAVSPLGLINDAQKQVTVLLDRDVFASPDQPLVMHPNVNTASVVVKTSDLVRFLEHCGNERRYVTIESVQE